MSSGSFSSLDLVQFHRAMDKVHEHVADRHHRVELTRPGCEDVCVMLSKAELESLEQALEIFAQTTEYRSMCDELSRLATECGRYSCPGE